MCDPLCDIVCEAVCSNHTIYFFIIIFLQIFFENLRYIRILDDLSLLLSRYLDVRKPVHQVRKIQVFFTVCLSLDPRLFSQRLRHICRQNAFASLLNPVVHRGILDDRIRGVRRKYHNQNPRSYCGSKG